MHLSKDPAISANETAGTYEAYDLGQKLDIWIKDSQTGKALFGKVKYIRDFTAFSSSWMVVCEYSVLTAS